MLNGSFIQENDTKIVNLSLNLLNEGKPALATSLCFQYLNESSLVAVETPEIVNHGDGSYTAAFTVHSASEYNFLKVSVLCIDQRGISIGANYTCSG